MGWKLEILKMLWGRGGHGLSLYVSVSRVSLYRDIDTKTSFVFWFVLCQGCICTCVQMYFYSDLLHYWMELCGCRRRALHLYFCCCQKNSFVLLIWFYFSFLRIPAFKHLSHKRQNFRNWSQLFVLVPRVCIGQVRIKVNSGAKWIQIWVDGWVEDVPKAF